MAFVIKNLRERFFSFFPLILLFYISFVGASVLNLKFFSINIHYILIYYWVLRSGLGFGFIFISGVITDVVLGLPLGVTPLTLLVIAGVATYVRVVTVRISLVTDWISFIPALLFADFVYYMSLYFLDFSIDYFNLFTSSVFTLAFYPLLWILFSLISNVNRN